MKNLDRIRKQLHPASRKKIAIRATPLISEKRELQELRHAHQLTQKRMAEVLGIGQDSVSRLERRSDLLILTLRGYVEAMGGRLSPIAGITCAINLAHATGTEKLENLIRTERIARVQGARGRVEYRAG